MTDTTEQPNIQKRRSSMTGDRFLREAVRDSAAWIPICGQKKDPSRGTGPYVFVYAAMLALPT